MLCAPRDPQLHSISIVLFVLFVNSFLSIIDPSLLLLSRWITTVHAWGNPSLDFLDFSLSSSLNSSNVTRREINPTRPARALTDWPFITGLYQTTIIPVSLPIWVWFFFLYFIFIIGVDSVADLPVLLYLFAFPLHPSLSLPLSVSLSLLFPSYIYSPLLFASCYIVTADRIRPLVPALIQRIYSQR